MTWRPGGSADAARVAAPPLSITEPRGTPASLKYTVPVGVPLPPLTAAVRVTDCPYTGALTEVLSATVAAVVPALFGTTRRRTSCGSYWVTTRLAPRDGR